ncbi:ABC transporter permease [Clostridium saccharobutylicum]|uniref:ABC-2 family transporter protein n=1 Tax=Clostridium saccharobutylicum DSM 13864 TaxID=1345695 RepID=U5MPI3_CLOSA|nr:ABC transporter permease [Clostridium saccharobutylicum]AGX41357.1 ABC-2 family transporter protein [Clostridium saccharobutylicum DSM 13864]AQR88640.1 ABC-2 family transporter protein [Clostridium saccharobutylicum]AQR98538.1 ABC-2 family transporter protein [Clostridium saccharobutylicum]AQS08250.1 ABC-2 family transporter protein [Clostridium saccharobutylicum]AQS12528.1 ABC-2 family transporter protein [Clostridium saccharobutylicum]
MKEFSTVFIFYLRKHLRSKGFMIITLLMCAAAVIMLLITNGFLNESKKEKLYIVNHTKELRDIWDSDVYQNDSMGDIQLDFSMLNNEDSDSDLVKKAKDEKISIAVFEEENGQVTMNVIDRGKINYTDISLLQNITKQILQTKNSIESGISPEVLKEINTTINIKNTNTSLNEGSVAVPFILFLVMILFIILYSNSAVNEIAYLKTNRVMEIFSTSIRPLPLYLGVNISAALIPVIQLSITGVCIWIMNNFVNLNFDKISSSIGIKLNSIDFSTLLLYMVFLLLGYFVYSFISTSLVSIVSRIEDINSISVPIAMIGLIQYFIGIIALQQDSLILKIFSYIPLTSPSVMFLRYACGYAGTGEVAVSICILVVVECMIAFLGAHLFTRGISYYGNLKEFLSVTSQVKKRNKNIA